MSCRLDNLAIRHTNRPEPLFRRLTLHIQAGERHGISGDSGSGKTTLLRTLAGLIQPVVTGTWSTRGRIAYIPQEGTNSLSPYLTIGAQTSESKLDAERLLCEVGLPGERLFHSYPHQISGGERQRVLVAQALALKPDLILADEPTANLDPETESQILEILKQQPAAILIASHRPRVFAQLNCQVHALTTEQRPTVKSRDRCRRAVAPKQVVQITDLKKSYGSHNVLNGINLEIRSGEAVVILGRSGSGKTTLAQLVSKRTGHLVQQEPSESLNPRFTIRQALDEAQAEVLPKLEQINIPKSWLDRKITDLSEGQRARIAILRSAANTPLLILDESLAGLDTGTRITVINFLNDRRDEGLALLLVTHDREAAEELGDARILTLNQGRLEEQ